MTPHPDRTRWWQPGASRPRDFQLLVCTGNLGNAQPDLSSVAAWLPDDGLCHGVMGSDTVNVYPVRYFSDLSENDTSGERFRSYPGAGYFAAYPQEAPTNREDGPSSGPRSRHDSNDNMSQVSFDRSFDYDIDRRFDMIVIGMQEATFTPHLLGDDTTTSHDAHQVNLTDDEQGDMDVAEANQFKPSADNNGRNGTQEDTADQGSSSPLTEPPSQLEPPSPRLKKKKSRRKKSHDLFPFVPSLLRKTVSTVSSLTVNRDHTKTKAGALDSPAGEHAPMAWTGARPPEAPLGSNISPDWTTGTTMLHYLLDQRLPSYRRIVSFQRGEMRLEIYVINPDNRQRIGRSMHSSEDDLNDRPENVKPVHEVAVLHVAAQNTGRAGLANKGGIVAELLIDNNTRVSFLTAHLEAHEGAAKFATRCRSLGDILSGTTPKHPVAHDVSMTSHFSFCLGDLNFRTDLPDAVNDDDDTHRSRVNALVRQRDWDSINNADELHRALKKKQCLVGFDTLFCNFPPTFKVERREGFVYNEKRRPSYTDRVLWKCSHKLRNNVQPHVYESVDNFVSSDHKPVRLAATIKLNEPFTMKARLNTSLNRRGSIMNLMGRGPASRASLRERESPVVQGSPEATPPTNEAGDGRLQLILSKLKCVSLNSELPPTTYVTVLSTPETLLRRKHTLGWRMRLPAVLGRSAKRLKIGGRRSTDVERYTFGWPRTSRMPTTFEPDWGHEEIAVPIRTHNSDGSPIDLTGAMLRFSLVDAADHSIIGTFSFNLVSLLTQLKGQINKTSSTAKVSLSRQDRLGRRASIRNFVGGMFGSGAKSEDRNAMGYEDPSDMISEVISPESARSNSRLRNDGSFDPVVSAEVDGPLLKHGRITGWISAQVDVWFLGGRTGKLLAARSPALRKLQSNPEVPTKGGASSKPSLPAKRDLPLSSRELLGPQAEFRRPIVQPLESSENNTE
jgi:hypothetical protein